MDKIKKLVMFAILMENHDGIRGKAPAYIKEKAELMSLTPEEMLCHLDCENQAKYKAWAKLWRIE